MTAAAWAAVAGIVSSLVAAGAAVAVAVISRGSSAKATQAATSTAESSDLVLQAVREVRQLLLDHLADHSRGDTCPAGLHMATPAKGLSAVRRAAER